MGGGIGDEQIDHPINLQQPKTFLTGGIREMFEESLFTFVGLMQKAGMLSDMTQNPFIDDFNGQRHTYKIDPMVSKDAVLAAKRDIESQGILYLFKPRIFGERSGEDDKNAIFIWNISKFCGEQLPRHIIEQRIVYQAAKPQVKFHHDLHAEPVAFAWIKAKDLEGVLKENSAQWVSVSDYAEHDEKTNKYVSIEDSTLTVGRKYRTRVTNSEQKKVLLSEVFIKMLHDRESDKYNPQSNIACIHNKDGNKLVFIPKDNKDLSNMNESSSMRAILEFLDTKHKIANIK